MKKTEEKKKTDGISEEIAEKYAERLSLKMADKLEAGQISVGKSVETVAEFLQLVKIARTKEELEKFITNA